MGITNLFLGLIGLIEITALLNRGGGPLVSHIVLTGITALIVLIFAISVMKKRMTLSIKKPHIFYGIFFLLFLISLTTSLTPDFGLNELLLFGNTGLLLVAISNLKLDEKILRRFGISLIGLAVIQVLIGARFYTNMAFPRFAGTFLDLAQPYTSFGNDFANWMLLIIPLAFAEFFRTHKRKTTTILAGLSLALLLSGFFLSFSRGAWLSLAAAGLLASGWYGWHIMRKNNKASAEGSQNKLSKKAVIVRACIVLILTLGIVQCLQFTRAQNFETTTFFQKVTMSGDEGAASTSERMEFWKGAVKIIKDRPWLGSGVLSFKYLFPKYQPVFGIDWDHPHNILLKIGVENGIIAVGFFLAFLIASALMIFRFIRKNPHHIMIPFLFGALASLGHNLLDFNFIVSNFTLFMVYIALALSISSDINATPSLESFPISRRARLIFTHLLLIPVIFFTMLAAHEAYYNVIFQKGRAALAQQNFPEAIMLLTTSQKMFSPRDLSTYLTLAYEKEFAKTKDEYTPKQEIAFIEQEISHSPLDAALIDRLGELDATKGDPENLKTAKQLFEKSIALDPLNHLRYYYDLLDFEQKEQIRNRQPSLDPALIDTIKKLLADYVQVLKNNGHYTIITDNPLYASKLYTLLDMEKERANFSKIWDEQLTKFTEKYQTTR